MNKYTAQLVAILPTMLEWAATVIDAGGLSQEKHKTIHF